MGSVYVRGNVLWLAYMGADGKRHLKSSGLLVGMESDAKKVLQAIERRVAAELRHGPTEHRGPPTVESFGRRFFESRLRAGVGIASIEVARLSKYILPFSVAGVPFGSLLLADVRPHHVRDFVRHLGALDIAPRTARHVYFQLRLMFHEAVTDELIASNPCVLKKSDIPKKLDKDPTWRPTAVFTRDEVEALISELSTPEIRRLRYALLFLTGQRIGELAARRFSDLDMRVEPLGRLTVSTSFNQRTKQLKRTKTGSVRAVPVHPTLARVLASWRLSGFEKSFGRPPAPDDLLCPSETLGNLRDGAVLRQLHADCLRLGFRTRRTHDSRRTFISLARGDGANKDTLRQVTHGGAGDQLDGYTTLDWASVCAEVSKLKIKLLDGKLLALPVAANGGAKVQALHPQLQAEAKGPKASELAAHLAALENGRGGTRTLGLSSQGETTSDTTPEVAGASALACSVAEQDIPADRSDVAGALFSAREKWIEGGDRRALRRALLSLLAEMDGAE